MTEATQPQPEETVEQEQNPSFRFNESGGEFFYNDLTETQKYLYDSVVTQQQTRQRLMEELNQASIAENFLSKELKKSLGVEEESHINEE